MIFDNLCWALSIYTRLNDLDLNSRSQASLKKIFYVFIFLSALSLHVMNICSVIIHNLDHTQVLCLTLNLVNLCSVKIPNTESDPSLVTNIECGELCSVQIHKTESDPSLVTNAECELSYSACSNGSDPRHGD